MKHTLRPDYSVFYTNDDNNSDYEPHPKRQQTINPGLRNPSKERVDAYLRQRKARLRQEKETDKNQTICDLYPIRATPADKNKKCPFCEETFYYDASIKTHITHGHSSMNLSMDEINKLVLNRVYHCIQGINTPSTTSQIATPTMTNPVREIHKDTTDPKLDVQGTNKPSEPEVNSGLLGTNNDTEHHTPDLSQISEDAVNGTNKTENPQPKPVKQTTSSVTNSDTNSNLVVETTINTEAETTGSSNLPATTTKSEKSLNPKLQIGINWYGHHKHRPKPRGKH